MTGNGGELLHGVILKRTQTSRLERPQVIVERVDDQPEGKILLKLGRPPDEDEVPSPLGAPCQLGQQARLADPRLADHLHHARLTGGEAGERQVEIGELARSSD